MCHLESFKVKTENEIQYELSTKFNMNCRWIKQSTFVARAGYTDGCVLWVGWRSYPGSVNLVVVSLRHFAVDWIWHCTKCNCRWMSRRRLRPANKANIFNWLTRVVHVESVIDCCRHRRHRQVARCEIIVIRHVISSEIHLSSRREGAEG